MIMMNILMMSMMLFFVGIIGFLSFNNHIFSMLLMLEFILLSVMLLVGINSMVLYFSWTMLMVLLVMVCESVIGMSGMILMSRSYGHEMMISMNMLMW